MRDKQNVTVGGYIRPEKWTLVVVAVSGIFYNVGMTAGPWFEGKLAQYLCDIIAGRRAYADMGILAAAYVLVILLVQGMRYIKRLYVRKFANHINRDMKEDMYHSMIRKSQAQLEQEGIGALMTKAIADVDACVEGIRKFTTEIFDTGVVMVAYLVMLFTYDWRLTLLSMIFPPIAYIIADKLKKVVTRSARAYKESEGELNAATYDRVEHAVTYRIYGQETRRNAFYERQLDDYEQKAVRANIWENAMQPVYEVISMIGAICILWFGAKNVQNEGWVSWDIAAFVTFLSCFTKLAAKSSKAAKLFNAVQKARVSWKRIVPMLADQEDSYMEDSYMEDSYMEDSNKKDLDKEAAALVRAHKLAFCYPGSAPLFSELSFTADSGQIIGITGPVACGKSTLGKLFLGDLAYEGSLQLGGGVTYMGHEPELIGGTIEDNILMGTKRDAWEALAWVCMDEEVRQMPEGIHTRIGNGGVTLSGGQQARIALARTLVHRKEILVLDDPFSAVDMRTEQAVFDHIRTLSGRGCVFIISHRLSLFPQMNQVLWMENGRIAAGTHEALMQANPTYASFYEAQHKDENRIKGGDSDEA